MKITSATLSMPHLKSGKLFPMVPFHLLKKSQSVRQIYTFSRNLLVYLILPYDIDGLSNVILLSHIPLSRSEMASCGPHRERGGIRRSAGPGYQSMLGKDTTLFLLNNLDPLVVFR